MKLVQAVETDLDFISKIYTANWLKTYYGLLPTALYDLLTIENSKTKWAKYLQNSLNNIIVAKNENEVFGFIAYKPCQFINNSLMLDSLHIAELAQNKGIGKELFCFAENFALKHNYENLSICVVRGNDRAENIYRHWGAKFLYDFFDELYEIKFPSRLLVWENWQLFK